MQILRPNGMVERFGDHQKRSQFHDRYGRQKDGAPRGERTAKIAAEQDRRGKRRDVTDPLRGRLLDLTA